MPIFVAVKFKRYGCAALEAYELPAGVAPTFVGLFLAACQSPALYANLWLQASR